MLPMGDMDMWRQIRSRLGRARRRLGRAIRGGEPILQDMSMDARRQMWLAAPDLEDRHVQNCRVLRNRVAMLEFMPKRAVCAEVGIWTGEFSAHILQATQPAMLHRSTSRKSGSTSRRRAFDRRSSADRCGFISAISPPFCPLCPRLISTGSISTATTTTKA